MKKTIMGTGLSVLAAGLLLVGCGAGGGDAGSPSTAPAASASASEHNDTDVTFARMMIPHHQQAVRMAELAASRSESSEVKDMAARIERAQGPEIETMTGWLSRWGVDSSMPGMDHGGAHDMPGMMSADDMRQLDRLRGAEFDERFLRLMIAHHEGALDMARTELSQGSNGEAKALARSIETGQSAEIEQMRRMLSAN